MNALKYLYYLFHPNKIVIRRFSKGLGDNLMLSYLSSAVKQTFPHKKVVLETEWPALFTNNPTIDFAVKGKKFPFYCKPKYIIDKDTRIHVLKQLIDDMTLPLKEPEKRLELHLRDEDIAWAQNQLPERYIVTCPVGKGSFSANRREWGFERFQETFDLLNGIPVVQVGAPSDPLLNGAHDYRSIAYPIRTCAAVIENATLAFFLEGGLMHLANAVGTPTIALFGGAIKPELTGYRTNINLSAHPHCSPCFTSRQPMTACGTMECMQQISPSDVVAAANLLLSDVAGG